MTRGYAVACSPDGTVAAVGGFTSSSGFPGTAASGTSRGVYSDGFVARFGPDGVGGTSLSWARYVGGYGFDFVNAVAVAGTDVFAAGSTDTGGLGTPGAFQLGLLNGDAFVAKFAPDGAQRWFSYFGGAGADEARSVTVFANGDVGVGGTAGGSSGGDAVPGAFPATLGAHQTVHGGGTDAFAARLSSDGTTLLASSILGGTGAETGAGLAVLGGDSVVVVGATNSSSFPVRAPLQMFFAGGSGDGIAARFSLVPGAAAARSFAVASHQTGLAIVFRWTPAAPGAVSQRVLRRPISSGAFESVAGDLAPFVGDASVLNIPSGSVADFVVETTDQTGHSTWSNVVRVNDAPVEPAPLGTAPTDPVVTPVGARFHFAWQMATPFDGEFEVEEAQVTPGEVVRSAFSRVAGTQRSTKLPAFGPRGSALRFRVRAMPSEGPVSAWTEPVYAAVTATRTISWFSATLRHRNGRPVRLGLDAEIETSELTPWTFNPATDQLVLQIGDPLRPQPIVIPAGDFGWRVRGRRAVWLGSRSAIGTFGGRLVIDVGERRVHRLRANLRGIDVSVPEDRSVGLTLRLADEFGLSSGTWTERRPGVLRTFGSN